MTELLLGIDVGTYSSKGVLCRPDGSVVATAQRAHALSVPEPGLAEHDADDIWWVDVCSICRELMASLPRGDHLAAASFSAIGPCLLPLDSSGRPLRAAILYGIDTRAWKQIADLEQRYTREALVTFGGMRLTSQAVGPKIAWLRENEPEVYAAASYFVTATSYLVFRLTGELVIDRHTASHFNPLIDIDSLQWDERFAEGITPLARLPALRWSDEIVGTISDRAAADTGLPHGTPVAAGTVETLAEAISVGAVDVGDLMLMYGSTAFLILRTETATRSFDLWSASGAFPGSYGLAAGIATSGAAVTWFRDEFAKELLRAEQEGGRDAFEALADEAAASPPGARGLLALPYLSGERTLIHDPGARGVFAGISLAHTRGDLYRSLLEGIGFGIASNIDAMRASGVRIERVIAVGGGTADKLWLQIVSDIAGCRQLLPLRTIGASYGDAFIAGLAVGLIDRVESLRQGWVEYVGEIVPDPERNEFYGPLRVLFRDLYEGTHGTVHALNRQEKDGSVERRRAKGLEAPVEVQPEAGDLALRHHGETERLQQPVD